MITAKSTVVVVLGFVIAFILSNEVGLSKYEVVLKPMEIPVVPTATNATATSTNDQILDDERDKKSSSLPVTSQSVESLNVPEEKLVAEDGTQVGNFSYEAQRSYGRNTPKTTTIHSAFLKYGTDVQANQQDVEYSANFTLSSTGEACFHFLVPNAEAKCQFPYIRLRLTGAALVNVPIRREKEGDATRLSGCSLLPVPGVYHVDVNLIHCRVNAKKRRIRPKKFKKAMGSPLWPDFDRPFQPHQFEMPPFVREGKPTWDNRTTTAYPNYAWVFAPTCKGSKYVVSEQCSQGVPSPYLPTKFQSPEFLRNNNFEDYRTPEMHARFDNYMWLPVDPSTGTIEYDAEHFGYEYSPMPKFLEGSKSGVQNQTIVFIGASHVRYLANQVSQIYYNITYGADGCQEEHVVPPDLDNNQTRFDRIYLRFADQWIGKPMAPLLPYANFDKYILTIGHWDAGFPLDRPTPPGLFLEDVLAVIGILEKLAQKPSAEIFVTSVNQHSLGKKMLTGVDWRIPPLIDAYNDELRTQVDAEHPITSPRSFRFRNFSRSFFLDNTDIVDPVWDSASDFYHPCRYAMRPMALRVLDLLKE